MSLLATVVKSLLEKYPNSKIELGVTNVGNNLGNMSYTIRETFSYGSVVALSNLINPNFELHLGYIRRNHPVALIGVPGKHDVESFLDVWEYGKSRPKKPIKFTYYDEETARRIQNYSVYGDLGLDFIKEKVKFNKISLTFDMRLRIKNALHLSVLDMDYEFYGKYSFDYIQKLIKSHDFRYTANCVFGKVGDNNIAIIGLNSTQIPSKIGFRGVWELGENPPDTETFCVMDYSEAKEIKDFIIFGYICFLSNRQKYPISRINRTLNPNFNFYVGNKDIRLINYQK